MELEPTRVEQWLRGFDPNPDALLDLLLPQIDDYMLREIAFADYGRDVERHLAPLKLFRDERVLPVLDWHPAEVLELIRWSEPEDKNWKPGGEGRYGHLLRAFACSTLLRVRERTENWDTYDSYGDTTVQLERSIVALGAPFISPGARFFAWCIERLSSSKEVGDNKLFFGLALLSLTTKLPDAIGEEVVPLCEWIDGVVSATSYGEQAWIPWHLVGLKSEAWAKVGEELRGWSETQQQSDRVTWVGLIGNSLAETRNG